MKKTISKFSWPSVSFAIATFNSERTIEKCLSKVRMQDYPASVEIVLGDGGSRDSTLQMAKKYKAKVINIPTEKEGAEYNKGIAVNNTKNEILALIDHDNILPHKNWLKNMVLPLVENKKIIGSGVLRFLHDKDMTLLDRYFALIGGVDPVAVFLNKSAHQSYLYDGFHLSGKLLEEKGKYFHVYLDPDSMPALGGNGAILRRKFLKIAKADPEHFFHIDIHVDLAKKGFRDYAFVKDAVCHLTNNKIIPFLKRRKFYIEKYHFEDQSLRRYSVYEPKKDRFSLLLYVLYSLSIVLPLSHSIRGYIKVRDVAWFIHPLMCIGMLFVYGVPTIKEEFRRVFLGK